jgi:hypothetical protein
MTVTMTRAVPSTTVNTLRSLRVALTVGCVVSGAFCLLVFTAAHRTVDRGARQSAQAVLQVDAVYGALVDADYAATTDIRSKAALLGGTASQFDNDIAIVHQGLELVAEHNAAGDRGERQLELVDGVVVSYAAQIHQAGADLQQGNANLSLVYLRNASYLLHQENGILDDLDTLRDYEHAALDRQRSSVWVAGATSLLWLLPLLGVLALLGATQVLIRRRFRRLLSVRLLSAGAALLVMGVTTGLSLVSNAQFAAAVSGPFSRVRTQETRLAARADASGHAELAKLIADRCAASGRCSAETTRPEFLSEPVKAPPATAPGLDVTTGVARFTKKADAADAASGVRTLVIIAMALASSVLIAYGIRPRINEYRFGRS